MAARANRLLDMMDLGEELSALTREDLLALLELSHPIDSSLEDK